MDYVNIHGERVSVTPSYVQRPPKKEAPASYHKGWRVSGVSPQRLAEAEAEHNRLQGSLRPGDREAFNKSDWLRKAPLKAVQSKPLATSQAAGQLADMAKKAGWLCVVVIELKKGHA